MPDKRKTSVIFSANEIKRQNAAYINAMIDPMAIIAIAKQAGLPSIAAIYQDYFAGQLMTRKKSHLEALIKDVCRLEDEDFEKSSKDYQRWIDFFNRSGKYLYIHFMQLLLLLQKNEINKAALDNLTKPLCAAMINMTGRDFSYWYLHLDTLYLPVMAKLVKAIHSDTCQEFSKKRLAFANELLAIIVERLSLQFLDNKNFNLSQFYRDKKNSNEAALLKHLYILTHKKLCLDDELILLSKIAYTLFEANNEEKQSALAAQIFNELKTFHKEFYIVGFKKDICRNNGIIIYQHANPQNLQIRFLDAGKVIESGSDNQEYLIKGAEAKPLAEQFARYFRIKYGFANQTIAYLQATLWQNGQSLLASIFTTNLAYNFKAGAPHLSVEGMHFHLLLDKDKQLRYLICQAKLLKKNNDDAREKTLLGILSIVHEIPAGSLQGNDALENYVSGSFSAVSLSLNYEPVCKEGQLHFIENPALLSKLVRFLLKPFAYIKQHPFKSLFWFGLGLGLGIGVVVVWPWLSSLLLLSNVANSVLVISSFLNSQVLAASLLGPILGLGFLLTIASIQGNVRQAFPNFTIHVSDKDFITEKLIELKTEEAKANSDLAASTSMLLNTLSISSSSSSKSLQDMSEGSDKSQALFTTARSSQAVVSKANVLYSANRPRQK